jgi:hypothetical protein
LRDKYGYNHPPRAVRDVKEHGIPIEMFRVAGADGRRIAAYRFGDPAKVRIGKFMGRTALNRRLKEELIRQNGPKCAIYLEEFDARELQIDHRVPFEVSGNAAATSHSAKDFMLLCGSANRAKSWSCEHCANWLERKDPHICRSCYWAFPEDYAHVAMRPTRRLDIMWSGAEVRTYDRLRRESKRLQQDMPAYVKRIVEKHLQNGR